MLCVRCAYIQSLSCAIRQTLCQAVYFRQVYAETQRNGHPFEYTKHKHIKPHSIFMQFKTLTHLTQKNNRIIDSKFAKQTTREYL